MVNLGGEAANTNIARGAADPPVHVRADASCSVCESVVGFRFREMTRSESTVIDDESAGRNLSRPVESREVPDWFREQQREAWEQFESLPSPTRKDQLWRFSNVDLLDLSPFKIPAPLSEDDR